ncbi:MAG: insulinase family protein, partial [Bacteroidia bacterium]|nr:insulinase family protein [Bacteroidia bacterium]
EIFQRVKKYFGNIPSGPSLSRHEVNIAKRTEDTREYYEDRVTEPRVSMYWNVPEWGTREATMLDLASSILSTGKSSRLYKKIGVRRSDCHQCQFVHLRARDCGHVQCRRTRKARR